MNVFQMKQKAFSFKDKYKIFDASQNQVYHCSGHFLSFTRKKDLYDSKTDKHIYTLKRKLFSLLPKYELSDPDGSTVAMISKKFSLLKHKIDITSKLGDFVMEGNFSAHNFAVLEHEKEIITVHKKWLSWGDSYEITINDDTRIPLFLGLVLMIDDCLHSRRNRRFGNYT